jgi:hypothetical protein|tara:strand:+ start:1923 stop:2369 length:447 start_codon:yes stop_codon:yes gene_type:complete
MARPSDYTPELGDLICSELADGKSMRAVCLPDEMPDKATVFRWIRTKEGFRDQYARAKEESADALTDEMLDIADDSNLDYTKTDEDGVKLNSENIQRSRLRIDTRKWLASKLKPKKFGDKQYIETKDTTEEVSDDDLDDRILALMNKK